MATLAIFRPRRIVRWTYLLRHSGSLRTVTCAASTSRKRNREFPCFVICPSRRRFPLESSNVASLISLPSAPLRGSRVARRLRTKRSPFTPQDAGLFLLLSGLLPDNRQYTNRLLLRSQERLAYRSISLFLPDSEQESCQLAVSCSSIAGMSRRL